MPDRLFRRLEQFGARSVAEMQALTEAPYDVREVSADRDLVDDAGDFGFNCPYLSTRGKARLVAAL